VIEKVMQSKNDKTTPSGVHLRYVLFVLSVVYWGTWLCFYGTIWMWAAIPHSHQSVWRMNRVWTAFQATVDAPDALTKLTACLQEALPEGNATIVDFTACLRSMGIAEGT
jgi:hypothetical protein